MAEESAYRSGTKASSISNVETEALVDLLRRARAVRRRFALPTLLVAAAAALAGSVVHLSGAWSVLGRLEDGSYFISTPSVAIAACSCAAPFATIGVAFYLVARSASRRAWIAEFRKRPTSEEWTEREAWLTSTSRRFS